MIIDMVEKINSIKLRKKMEEKSRKDISDYYLLLDKLL